MKLDQDHVSNNIVAQSFSYQIDEYHELDQDHVSDSIVTLNFSFLFGPLCMCIAHLSAKQVEEL